MFGKKEQIERLFDSIMRGYPIGAFLFWELDAKVAKDYVFYEFLKDYDERTPYNRRILVLTDFTKPKTAMHGSPTLMLILKNGYI